MVDITEKDKTDRKARAKCVVKFPSGVLKEILDGGPPKGDLFATARIAGIQGAKNTVDWIPLSHIVQITHVNVELDPQPDHDQIRIESTVRASDATGVEMEALTAVSAAALTLYDMCKSEHKGIVIKETRLLHKEGGKSGTWTLDDN